MRYEKDSATLNGAAAITRDVLIFNGYYPYEYTSPEHELLGARESAWLGMYLTGTGRMDIVGPDAVKLLNEVCVNRDFSSLKVGGSRHALICTEEGYLKASGIVIKRGENHFETYALFPLMSYAKLWNLDVEVTLNQEYFFQIDGPKSLEIMEEACQCDLHDLRFGRNKTVKINGKDMVIHRLGMSGALAYEVHGDPEDAQMVYQTIREAGEKFDIRPLGIRNYIGNHTSGGYPNQFVHFIYAGDEVDPMLFELPLTGSASDAPEKYYVTPYDVGWEYLINFEHEFPGKAALQKISQNPPKAPVTLEWNLEDVAAVVASEIDGTGVEADEEILGYNNYLPEFRRAHGDKVMCDGKDIGIASGRIKDYFYKTFISLAFIDKEYVKEGTEVVVMWGKAGKQQKKIRAKVARFPYFNEEFRNETFDVDKISRRTFE